jgi:biotin operon repressor
MKRALAAAMLSALATGAVLATVGFGAGSTTATTSSKKSTKSSATTTSGPPKTMKQVQQEMEARRAEQQKKLAAALGVSTGKLTDALDQIKKDGLAADVKANRLTQAQADAILACDEAPLTCDRSNLPAGPHRRGGKGARGTMTADLAKALGVSEDKLQEAFESTRPDPPTRGVMPGGRGRGGHGHGPGGPGGPGMGGGGFGPFGG